MNCVQRVQRERSCICATATSSESQQAAPSAGTEPATASRSERSDSASPPPARGPPWPRTAGTGTAGTPGHQKACHSWVLLDLRSHRPGNFRGKGLLLFHREGLAVRSPAGGAPAPLPQAHELAGPTGAAQAPGWNNEAGHISQKTGTLLGVPKCCVLFSDLGFE
ncbi:hypothetical protein H920_08881 [Fukomys damarensis]|uniref:Uncharacterized protein n=1 Tax=Fukomys damarensis TaxID=885580 RepID=A0A091E3U5_FUKDA|nr:hypothetical protein H920_08881 [Fukomys damarensis]